LLQFVAKNTLSVNNRSSIDQPEEINNDYKGI
jgi:hypothetical protein